MLPNFDQIGRVMAEIVALIERGVVALESINRHVHTLADIEYRRARSDEKVSEYYTPPNERESVLRDDRPTLAHKPGDVTGDDDGS